jgi:2-dehydropantoate 2-reductase
VIAALADRAGHEVSVTARGEQLDAIVARGLHLTGHWGEHTAHVQATRVLVEPPDLALLTVKAQDAPAAVRANASALAGVPLVVVQNGLGGAEAVAELLPKTPVIGGLALFAASFLAPGEAAITTPATTYLGGLPATPQEVFDGVVAVLGGVMPVETIGNFTGAQWTKLIVNQVNALPAITGLSVQETVADDRLRRVLTDSMREAVRIARAGGVHFETLLGLSDPLLRVFVAAPYALAAVLPRLIARRMGATPNPGSTLQSIRRGQLTEIDHLNGAVVTAAGAAGMTAPINARLVELVHRVEREHAFIAPDEVFRAVFA